MVLLASSCVTLRLPRVRGTVSAQDDDSREVGQNPLAVLPKEKSQKHKVPDLQENCQKHKVPDLQENKFREQLRKNLQSW